MNHTSNAATLTIEETQLAQDISRMLNGQSSTISLRLTDSKNELPLPAAAVPLLVEMMNQLGKGKAVEVLGSDAEIPLQRAADLLHVSRAFLLGLLDKQELPFRRAGSQRRLRLADVLAYKQRTDQLRLAALNELTQLSQELGLGYD